MLKEVRDDNMTKTEEVNNMFETAELISEYHNSIQTKNSLEQESKKLTEELSRQKALLDNPQNVFKPSVVFPASLGVIAGLIYAIYNLIKDFKQIFKGDILEILRHIISTILLFLWNIIIPFLIVFLIAYLIVVITQSIKYKSQKEQFISDLKSKIGDTETRIKSINEQISSSNNTINEQRRWLQNNSCIPEPYWQYAFELCAYIKVKRADTLKESINVLEEDLHRIKMDEKIRQIERRNQEMSMTMDQQKQQLYNMNTSMQNTVVELKKTNKKMKRIDSSVNSLWWKV